MISNTGDVMMFIWREMGLKWWMRSKVKRIRTRLGAIKRLVAAKPVAVEQAMPVVHPQCWINVNADNWDD